MVPKKVEAIVLATVFSFTAQIDPTMTTGRLTTFDKASTTVRATLSLRPRKITIVKTETKIGQT